MRSMTGYGRGEHSDGCRMAVVEIRSVNSRNLEINIKLPRGFLAVEEKIRQSVANWARRGKFDVYVTCSRTDGGGQTVVVNEPAAAALGRGLAQVAGYLSGLNVFLEICRAVDMGNLLQIEKDAVGDDDFSAILQALEQGLASHRLARDREGLIIRQDIACCLSNIRAEANKIADRLPAVADEYEKRLRKRIMAMIEDYGLAAAEPRIIQEVAIWAEKNSIHEEMSRLGGHLEQVALLIEETDVQPLGKKIDFIAQEMHREINTIGSKVS
ncbi:MAG: DUF1732 domain-containing protein, partial [Negativicutes bacterium]|nr:DUF1732 domain-containing protein [Negativicutes bacterium]